MERPSSRVFAAIVPPLAVRADLARRLAVTRPHCAPCGWLVTEIGLLESARAKGPDGRSRYDLLAQFPLAPR